MANSQFDVGSNGLSGRAAVLPSSTGPAHEVEVFAWLWWVLRIDPLHQMLEYDEFRQTADAAAILTAVSKLQA